MAALSLEGIGRRFGAVRALEDVSLSFEAGSVHAVVGENGAGKSTLLKIASGLLRPDSGLARVDGAPLAPHTAREAVSRGVGLVEQHFALVGAFTVLENVMLGAEPVRSLGRLDFAAARERASRVAGELGVSLPWGVRAETLGVGDRQRLEIVRVLARDARVLLLDEPTAALVPGEALALYGALRRLADAGRAVVVVTHRLDELRRHVDRVSVLRRGRLVSSRALAEGDEATLSAVAADMMGGEAPAPVAPRRRHPGAVLLELRDVRRAPGLRGATLAVRAGEVVGVAGVEGNGQRELVRVVAGLDAPDGGELRAGEVAALHEDRQAEGLILDASVRDNLVLGELGAFSRFGLVDGPALERTARSRLERFGIVPPDLDAPARSLSGGNQQKVVIGRALARAEGASVLVLAQPTRGADLRAAQAIHAEIEQAAERGCAVLVVSADLSELRRLCDRILVMVRGRIVAELPPDAPDARIGEAMLGRATA